MADSKEVSKDYEVGSDLLGTLFNLPVANLESRLKMLEAELRKRKAISHAAVSSMGTRLLALEDLLLRSRYSPEMLKSPIRSLIVKIEGLKLAEQVSHFRDSLEVSKGIQEAWEHLYAARTRNALLTDSLEGQLETDSTDKNDNDRS